jgi:hypothetical protein
MTSIWRRIGDWLVPCDAEALAELHAHKDHSEMRVTLNGARNPKQHRLFFALVNILAEQDPQYNGNVIRARHDILRTMGHVDYEVDRFGTAHVNVKSMAYSAMTQAEFNELFQGSVNLVCDWLGTAPSDIRNQVNEMVGDKRYEGMRR